MNSRTGYIILAATVFVSSFLLFQIQPLLAKHVLPWFGGSSAVWITAMFFFMFVLALGYFYAVLLSGVSKRLSVTIHGIILILTSILLLFQGYIWPSAVTPMVNQISLFSEVAPIGSILYTFSVIIGIPFFLLSTTSSLLQYWYGKTTGKEPFSLYSVSNTGSLLGLLSYPFLIEPFSSTFEQGVFWSGGYVLFGVLLLIVLAWVLFSTEVSREKKFEVNENVDNRQFLKWVLLASLPVIAMLTGTSYVSGFVAPVPFLWIVPLALYLISFIISFKDGIKLPPFFTYAFLLVFCLATNFAILSNDFILPIKLFFIFGTMFGTYHLCHEKLYQLRPLEGAVTIFYAALSLGGIIGSLVVLAASLYLLPIPIEFMLVVAGVAIYSGKRLFGHENSLSIKPRMAKTLLIMTSIIFISSVFVNVNSKMNGMVATERNFYGYKAVFERDSELGMKRTLVHGTTNHGYQYIKEPLSLTPVAYYGESSGVGLAINSLRGDNNKSIKVALIGLGSGILSAYYLPGDKFEYFEIDPEVVEIARRDFTYLNQCGDCEISLGDARLLLKQRKVRGDVAGYDLVVVDAYADDMVPTHLMSEEAVALYKELLKPEGILAVHISSRYLMLQGVVKGTIERNKLFGTYISDRPVSSALVGSDWVLAVKTEGLLQSIGDQKSLSDYETIYWTDSYSSLLSVLKLW